METVRIAGMKKHSSVNGPGVRCVIFFQGCPHHCKGCQNPETWDPQGGQEVSVEKLIREISEIRYLDGITLSGGDPLLQGKAAGLIAVAAKQRGLNVWAYTGWTFEQLREAGHEDAWGALKYIDVLVDGRFEAEKLTEEAIWRGSSNQRLIDVQESLRRGETVLWSEGN